jgi:hypothetical protein
MALHLGELVGTIRADDSGWRSGLREAQLQLAGFTRMTDGRLRDMHGRFVAESDAMSRTLGRRLTDAARRAGSALLTAGRAAGKFGGAVGVGVPVVAAMTAALGGFAAGAVAAGVAVGAFKAASQPQLDSVKEASEAAQKAEEAHEKAQLKQAAAAKLAAKGGDEYKRALREAETASRAAKEADLALQQQLKGLPPATRETAVAFGALKNDYKAWSDSLAGDTMPVFTKGINILRDLLPTLTPFVKAAARAFGDFLDRVAAGLKSAKFKEWAADMAAAAGPALSGFLRTMGNFAKGFGGMMQAFLPASTGMTGGLLSMSEAFARWGTGLKHSEGFAQFLDLAKEGAGVLRTIATAALGLLVALSPLIGVTAQIALWLAQMINAIPPGVLTAIGTAIGIIVLAVKAYGLYVAIAAAVTRAWAIAQGIFNAVMMLNPIGLVVAAIAALVTIVVIAYQKSETFRQIVQAVWTTVKDWIIGAVEGIAAAISWFGELPGLISGWFGAAKDWAIRQALAMVTWLAGWPRRVWSALASLGGLLLQTANSAFTRFRDAAVRKATAFVSWVRGLPGRISSAIGSLGGLLVSKGADIVRGLWNGIKSMGAWLKNTLIGWAKSMIPGPIARALGIASPSKVMAREVGRWIPAGVVEGVKSGQSAVDRTMAGLVTPLGTYTGAAGAAMGGTSAAAGQRLIVEVRGPEEMKRLIRTIVVRDGGGSVQRAFG